MSTTALVVRDGVDARMQPQRDGETGSIKNAHTLMNVHTEMFLQIMRDFPALPDPPSLTLSQIRFFYDGVRGDLRRATKPKSNK